MASIPEVTNKGLANYYIALASIFIALRTIGLNKTLKTYLAKEEKDVSQ